MSSASLASLAEADVELEAALLRHKRGEVESAYHSYRKVLAQYPEHATAIHYLALVAQQAGRTDDAERLLRRSIALKADDARAYNHLGQVLLAQGRFDDAIACFENGLALNPRHVDSINNLANTLKTRGRLGEAIELYRSALAIDPRATASLYNLGNALKDDGLFDEALQMFDRALESAPEHVSAHLNVAVLLEEKGRFDAAIEHYRAVLKIEPGHAKALSGLMAIRSYEPEPEVVAAALRGIDSRDIDNDGRVKLHYGLGKHYDRNSQFDQAFEHFVAANQILKRRSAPFDRKRVSESVDRTIELFSAEYFAQVASAGDSSSEQPVFIVGMPRSGSTLTEHILASHPDVFGAGELQELPRLVKGLGAGYPETLLAMTASERQLLAEQYLVALRKHAPAGVARI
ncbi:tetratricopeptide repeat-containing sulfotransferase family protein, partial [Steroidobacter sp.]|uniref:tetratricopeptide repeat-containing sulfotransferase family protein n=1 Tax=Steroidobacter sp. TaxID=1978227 RepID=UPI001A57483D